MPDEYFGGSVHGNMFSRAYHGLLSLWTGHILSIDACATFSLYEAWSFNMVEDRVHFLVPSFNENFPDFSA